MLNPSVNACNSVNVAPAAQQLDFAAIKQQFDIVEVYERLTGETTEEHGTDRYANKEASCPFCGHKDCFFLYKSQRFKCFSGSCVLIRQESDDTSGDVIALVKEFTQAKDMRQAALMLHSGDLSDLKLAEDLLEQRQTRQEAQANEPAPEPHPKAQAIFEAAAAFYQELFEWLSSADFEHPLRQSSATRKLAQVGMTPGDSLWKRLQKQGFKKDEMVASGLVIDHNGRLKDYLPANVFIYPHFDRQGRVSHFTIKDPAKKLHMQLPFAYKLNGVMFYGEEMLETCPGPVALVEGENDRLTMLDRGWEGPVLACIGSLSRAQLEWIKVNLADRQVYTFFDNDPAGDKYREKTTDLGLPMLIHGKVPSSYKDVDEYLRAEDLQADVLKQVEVVQPAASIESAVQAAQEEPETPLEAKVGFTPSPIEAIPEQEQSPEQDEHQSDTGNGNRLVRLFGKDLRYITEKGHHLAFENGRWRVLGELVLELAKKVASDIQQEAFRLMSKAKNQKDLGEARSLLSFGISSANLSRLRAMIETSKGQLALSFHELNKDPMLLGVANGAVNLRTGELVQNKREYHITQYSPVAYHPDAKAPRWERFVDEICVGDKELAEHLQRMVGYWLTGSNDEQLLFFLYGGGCNGKSTFMNTVQNLLGSYATQINSDTLMKSKFDAKGGPNPSVAKLPGKRLVVANELAEDARMDENLVKSMTGEDTLVAREVYGKHEIEFRPQCSLVIVGNHRPTIYDNSHGMWRRMHLVPFNAQFDKTKLDPCLGDKLRAELPGILNWAIQGCLMWQQKGIKASTPACISQATQDYREESDLLGLFVKEHCKLGTAFQVQSKELHAAFMLYAKSTNEWQMKATTFNKKMEEWGRSHGVEKAKNNRGAVFKGIQLEIPPMARVPQMQNEFPAYQV